MDTEFIRDRIQDSIDTKMALIQTELLAINQVADVLINAFENGRALYLFGNGGSAADAQHIAAELVGTFEDRKRLALPAQAFTTNSSTMTALANDFEYDVVFARHVEAFVRKGDVCIGISTSGNSANVINGLSRARDLEAITVGFSGESGGKMTTVCDHLIRVPSTSTPRIQECHIMIGHVLCAYVEEYLFNNAASPLNVGGRPPETPE